MADTTGAASSSSGNYAWLGPLTSSLAGYFGSNSASGAQVAGNNNAIGTEQSLIPQLTGLYDAQRTTGNQSFSTLGQQLGINGQAPNYAAFDNSPGFQFATQMGQQAINRQAAASGNAYSSNTLANIGNYTQGMASQNYNNYVSQLMQTAGYGASGNANLGQNLYGIGANIAQTQAASGNAQAVGSAAGASAIGSAAGSLPWGSIISGVGSLFNNSGVSGGGGIPAGQTSTLDSLGGTNPFPNYTPSQIGTTAGLDSSGGVPLTDLSNYGSSNNYGTSSNFGF